MPVFFRFGCPILSAALLAFLISACDSGPGTTSLEEDPPVLSDFSFDPKEVATTGSDDDTVTFPLTMRVAVNSNGSNLEQVAYLVQSPGAGAPPIAQGTLDPADGQYYEKTVEISIPRGDVGLYTVLIYAVGEGGNLSNDVRGNLRFLGTGEPPIVEDVESDPAVVVPPTTLRLIATVSDPDGLGNIARVEVTTPNDATVPMEDDGESFGDEEAGDGKYTAAFNVDQAAPGTYTFTVVAYDKTGLESEPFLKDVVVE